MSSEPQHDVVPSAPPPPRRPEVASTACSRARSSRSRTRNFRLFFIGQTISNTGNFITNVALILFVLRLTEQRLRGRRARRPVSSDRCCCSRPGPASIADRGDKRKLLLVTQSLEMLQSMGLAILAFHPHPSLAALYVLALFGGVLLAFDNPLRRSFVPEMVPKEDLANAVVLYSTIVSVSQIFGPALAGLIATTLGYGWCFAIDAASYLAVIAAC